MPTVKDAVKVLSIETGEPENFVAQVSRKLLDRDLLPKSSGRRIAHVGPAHVAMLLIGIYAATKFADAADRAIIYSALRWGGEPDGQLFIEFLIKALADLQTKPDRRVRINNDIALLYEELRIEIVTSYPLVSLTSSPVLGEPAFDGQINFAQTPKLARFWPSNMPRRSVTIPGHVLLAIVSRLFGVAMPPAEEMFDRIGPTDAG